MTLIFFKYGLPLLLGYTLFVGISGRLNPMARPLLKEEHATWFLALWTGLCVSLVLGLALHMAYAMPLNQARDMLPAVASLIAGLLVPALALYAYLQHRTTRMARKDVNTSFNWSITEDEMHENAEFDTVLLSSPTVDISLEETGEEPTHLLDSTLLEVSPAYLETIRIDRMNEISESEAVNDCRAGTAVQALTAERTLKAQSGENKILQDEQTVETLQPDDELQTRLDGEIALREKTEKHLRITRKALSLLEAETRHHSIDKADALIELEEKLATSIEQGAEASTEAINERARRIEIEHSVVELKHKMVKAKQEIRRSAAARATALSTANKTIAFARQSVQIRARLEGELQEAHTTLDNRQNTISSLIRALEKEKRKTQDEVTSMARQLVLHEKQMKAKRTLEGVARSVENKLTSRLVKKVAKARPIASDLNPG